MSNKFLLLNWYILWKFVKFGFYFIYNFFNLNKLWKFEVVVGKGGGNLFKKRNFLLI